MIFRRQSTFAALALLGLAGCHAGNNGGLATRSDTPVARNSVTVDRFIASQNRNALAIKSLQASPSVSVTGAEGSGHLDGRMAFERSKNFHLELTTTLKSKISDIGSNDREFWFWVAGDKKDNAIYVCNYDEVKNSQLSVSLQPDWIIEALGFREITEREAATIDSRMGDPTKGEEAGTMILTQIRDDPRSRDRMLTKETIVNLETGRIGTHRLYSGAKKQLLAEARIDQYTEKTIAPSEAYPEGLKVLIPGKFELTWVEEKFSMVVTMGNNIRLNPAFTVALRSELFSEPKIRNASRFDLGKPGLAQASSGATNPNGRGGSNSRLYESMPSPHSGPIQLGQPSSADFDENTQRTNVAPPPMPPMSSIDVRPMRLTPTATVRAQSPDSEMTPAPPTSRWRVPIDR